MAVPNTLQDIRNKFRRVTARYNVNEISDDQIDEYINTFYIYDFPEHLRLESLRYTWQFTTTANIPVYDFPKELYLTTMPPIYIAGYQSYFTQSRENFFRINSNLAFLQQSVYTGTNSAGPYTGQFLSNVPLIPGFKPNPPGAYSPYSATQDIPPAQINYNLIVSALGQPDPVSGIPPSITLVDDGLGNLFSINDSSSNPANKRGTVNYTTGAITITAFPSTIPSGNPINVQYIPYVPSRPQSACFYQDQIFLYPVPDQAYTVSFEAYKYPTALIASDQSPQLREWWQLLAYGAADKFFTDSGDTENVQKFRPFLKEQMDLVQRRTIVQQTPDRSATIYTQDNQYNQYGFGNLFGGT